MKWCVTPIVSRVWVSAGPSTGKMTKLMRKLIMMIRKVIVMMVMVNGDDNHES